jgi:glycosyltransferase involved in cell wall biosynthesis
LLAKALHGIGFALSDRVLVDCNALVDEVRAVYRGLTWDMEAVVRRKVRVVHNAIDLTQFANLESIADIRPILGLKGNDVVIGSVSRLDEPKKGTAVLLRAARRVLVTCPDARFVICGEGFSRGTLEALARELGIAQSIQFVGYWPNAVEVFRALDVFVLPSLTEGFPTVNLEAMAAGVPVVTTNVGGAAEAVIDGECGYVVPCGDEVALATAIERLYQNAELRKSMSEKARGVVSGSFNAEVMALRVRDVYGEKVSDGIDGR